MFVEMILSMTPCRLSCRSASDQLRKVNRFGLYFAALQMYATPRFDGMPPSMMFPITSAPPRGVSSGADGLPDCAGPAPASVRWIDDAISSRSCCVSISDAAPIQPSTCAGVRAPTIAPVTPGHASVQAMATADTDVPWRVAIGRSASRSARLLSEVRLLELRRLAPPVVLGQGGDAIGREALGQDAGLHGAVADDARVVALAPRNLVFTGRAIDERKRRLQRIDVPDGFAPVEERDIKVGNASGGSFPPRRASPFRPMSPRLACRYRPASETEQIDALDAEPPQ